MAPKRVLKKHRSLLDSVSEEDHSDCFCSEVFNCFCREVFIGFGVERWSGCCYDLLRTRLNCLQMNQMRINLTTSDP